MYIQACTFVFTQLQYMFLLGSFTHCMNFNWEQFLVLIKSEHFYHMHTIGQVYDGMKEYLFL